MKIYGVEICHHYESEYIYEGQFYYYASEALVAAEGVIKEQIEDDPEPFVKTGKNKFTRWDRRCQTISISEFEIKAPKTKFSIDY